MKTILIFATLCILLTSGTISQATGQRDVHLVNTTWGDTAEMPLDIDVNSLLDSMIKTYYLSSEEPVYTYLQNRSIQRFFNMWFKEYIGSDIEPHWNYDTLAPVQILDHEFNSIAQSDLKAYTCTFSTDDGRCGYIIVSYGTGDDGPYISNMGIHETTPYQYDLKANNKQIVDALKKIDIDLSTVSASRVEWIDTDKNRGDRIILFTDGKGDKYICYFGEDEFIIEKVN